MRAKDDRTAAASAKVGELMTSGVVTCSPSTNAATAAELMLQADCGILPVVADGTLVGVVTDRDLFIALGTRNVRASDLQVGDVAQVRVWACGANDAVGSALEIMNRNRVRRLPVVDDAGRVVGMLSMNDLLLETGATRNVQQAAVVETLQAISTHHQPLALTPEQV